MPRRHVLSTHLLRLTARRAESHYQRVQGRAVQGDDGAKAELSELGIDAGTPIKVERAGKERAKWRVIATP